MARRLLILDDDEAVASMMAIIARTCGFETRMTAGPERFFQTVRKWRPTHVAIDLVMPEMDGVQVLGELAALRCRAKLIISSGTGARVLEAAQRSAAEHGLDVIGTLSKPFVAAALRAMLLGIPVTAPAGAAAGGLDSRAFQVSLEELDRCVRDGELQLVYQPKIECATNTLAGFEALVRWRHPQYGFIAPDRFIPFAERHGRIDALTEQILEIALSWFAGRIRRADSTTLPPAAVRMFTGATLSLNLSAESLKHAGFVERITEHCDHHQVAPGRLIFELTETSAMEDPVASLDLLTRMRMKGFHLSLDDFGTGYSSMLQLVRMPFTELKIDKSFVMSATRSSESRAVVNSIVDLARSLGIKSAAEGVEDAQTLSFLRHIGCDLAQGYWIGRGLTAMQVDAWIDHRAAAPGGDSAMPMQVSLDFP